MSFQQSRRISQLGITCLVLIIMLLVNATGWAKHRDEALRSAFSNTTLGINDPKTKFVTASGGAYAKWENPFDYFTWSDYYGRYILSVEYDYSADCGVVSVGDNTHSWSSGSSSAGVHGHQVSLIAEYQGDPIYWLLYEVSVSLNDALVYNILSDVTITSVPPSVINTSYINVEWQYGDGDEDPYNDSFVVWRHESGFDDYAFPGTATSYSLSLPYSGYWTVDVYVHDGYNRSSPASIGFRLNTEPQISITSPDSTVYSRDLSIEWDYTDADGDEQQGYTIIVYDQDGYFWSDWPGDATTTVSHTVPRPGTYVISVSVYDGYGFGSDSRSIEVINNPPTIELTAPEPYTSAPVFLWSYNDPDHDPQGSWMLSYTDGTDTDLLTGTSEQQVRLELPHDGEWHWGLQVKDCFDAPAGSYSGSLVYDTMAPTFGELKLYDLESLWLRETPNVFALQMVVTIEVFDTHLDTVVFRLEQNDIEITSVTKEAFSSPSYYEYEALLETAGATPTVVSVDWDNFPGSGFPSDLPLIKEHTANLSIIARDLAGNESNLYCSDLIVSPDAYRPHFLQTQLIIDDDPTNFTDPITLRHVLLQWDPTEVPYWITADGQSIGPLSV